MPGGAKAREILDGVVQVYLPLPMRPSIVNVYLVRAGGRWTLIDTGMNTEDSVAALRGALEEIGIAPQAIGRLVATHHHVDHFGTAAPYRELARAEVYVHPLEAQPAPAIPPIRGRNPEYLPRPGDPAGAPRARSDLRGPPSRGPPADRLPPRAQARDAGADPAPAPHGVRGGARRLRDRAGQPLPGLHGDGRDARPPGAPPPRGTGAADRARRRRPLPRALNGSLRHRPRCASSWREDCRMLKAGDPAPDFTATAHDGRRVRLADLRGKKVLLYFFPKADTPG